ncbi:DUF4270 domain-containing protein [Polaribacter sp.]|nr:DUF4270 domain-containing protein [Polaribacter sp.]
MKKIIKKSVYVSVFLVVFLGIISCEKDFTDIATTIITNSVFSTDKILVDVELENKEIDRLRTDNITLEPGQYLLGVYNSVDYEKLEASILSQVGIPTTLKYTDEEFDTADTTVISTIDTVFLKLPYQATLTENDATDPTYSLDSIFGNQEVAFTLNLYQSDEYLSSLDLDDPTQISNYFSDKEFLITGSPLNSELDYPFIPNKNDTIFTVKRRLSDSNLYDVDTIKITTASSDVPLPFARIPMDEAKFKTLFFDKYESPEFSSQDAFNNYFRGLILKATGADGSLISFDFNNRVSDAFNPSIEVYYTNTVVVGTQVFDTIKKSNSFPLSGIRRSYYNMGPSPSISNEQIKIQGTAGSEGSITLFGAADTDGNGVPDQLDELRLKNILVNDALLTIYVDQTVASDLAPERLYLYKDYVNPNSQAIVQSHLKDVFTGASTFGGYLETEADGKMKYTFRIPDYISELLNSETDYNPKLSIKALNATDLNLNDTIFRPYNWNPKMVTLLNESSNNGDKKAELKISYSKKED